MSSLHRMRQLALVAAPFFAVLMGGVLSAQAGQSSDWTVSEVHGDVFVKHGGRCKCSRIGRRHAVNRQHNRYAGGRPCGADTR